MKIFQHVFAPDEPLLFPADSRTAQLVLVFGSRARLEHAANYLAVRTAYPDAVIAGCSTAGEIHGEMVSDNTLTVTALRFADTGVRCATTELEGNADSFDAGRSLAQGLPKDLLAHVLIFSRGLDINGTELVRGLKSELPAHVEVTGGLAADGDLFQQTLVCANAPPSHRSLIAVGLYGERIKIGYGSVGGWDAFGPDRLITRAEGNVLYDLDGKPALELYKRYLAGHAAELPASALLFPLALRSENGRGVVRTVLAVDAARQSMTFAGDMPEGRHARLMKANFDRLVDGAIGAAEISLAATGNLSPHFALLVSCVGRKLVLKQRVDEEVEGVRRVLGSQAVLAGFYSYGEISPGAVGQNCELHNQTMTVTVLREQ